jgi:hypothetical protein
MDETRGGPKTEREFEIGRDESWFANVKRTYDEFQQESLETIREMRIIFNKLLTDAQQFDNARQTIANQSLQNAVETANMVSKQAVRHSDIAIDRQWNLDEVAHLAVGSTVSVDAIAAAVAAAVVKTLQGTATK